ncbi:hypothetical protein [Phenylobacterium sp. J367]|uniref:hypothetical protein n=1 Tax=Phenylobacterium sp. J367 TaxID=2898435 RepID=UPI0021510CE5|nr:hypothetical protein [Phenylobacterium sp. J367]MCR5879225.1 hypothetical protein [Phenylobacterium sp. J367]
MTTFRPTLRSSLLALAALALATTAAAQAYKAPRNALGQPDLGACGPTPPSPGWNARRCSSP